jgi:hypothetical protein
MIALNKIKDPRNGATAWEFLYLPDPHIKLTPSEREFIDKDDNGTSILEEIKKIKIIAEAMETDDEFDGIQIYPL